MSSSSSESVKVVSLPNPERPRPQNLRKPDVVSEKEAYSIAEFKLTGPQWVRMLSLLCSVIADDEYSDLEVAKVASLHIDGHLQGSPKFREEVKNLMKYGGPEVQMLVKKLLLPPWER
jgi:hypothetical protein